MKSFLALIGVRGDFGPLRRTLMDDGWKISWADITQERQFGQKQHVLHFTQLESSNIRSPVPCKHRSGK